jgi:hypothetical protein
LRKKDEIITQLFEKGRQQSHGKFLHFYIFKETCFLVVMCVHKVLNVRLFQVNAS